jgi:hypothetical protein
MVVSWPFHPSDFAFRRVRNSVMCMEPPSQVLSNETQTIHAYQNGLPAFVTLDENQTLNNQSQTIHSCESCLTCESCLN